MRQPSHNSETGINWDTKSIIHYISNFEYLTRIYKYPEAVVNGQPMVILAAGGESNNIQFTTKPSL